jgi:hypothetical protein
LPQPTTGSAGTCERKFYHKAREKANMGFGRCTPAPGQARHCQDRGPFAERLTPCFCAKVGDSYSVMQTGGISNRRIRRFWPKMTNIWYHQKTTFDLAKTKELSDDHRIWPDR